MFGADESRDVVNVAPGEVFYHVGLAIYLLNYIIFNTTELEGPSSKLALVVLCLMFVKTMLTARVTRTKILTLGLAAISALLSWWISEAYQFLLVIALIVGAQSVSRKHIAVTMLGTIVIGLAVVFALVFAGAIHDVDFSNATRLRHSLGFTYVGMFDMYVLHIAFLTMFLFGRRLNPLFIASFVALHVFAYSLSNARGVLVTALTAWFLFILICKIGMSRKRNKIIHYLAIFSIPICLFIAVYTAIGYKAGSPTWILVNKLFSGRLGLAQRAFAHYDVLPFGQSIQWIGNAAVKSGLYRSSDYNYVDSGYLQVLFQYGYVALILICVMYIMAALQSYDGEEGSVIDIWVLVLAVQSLIYPNLLLIAYNGLLLIALNCCFNRQPPRWDKLPNDR